MVSFLSILCPLIFVLTQIEAANVLPKWPATYLMNSSTIVMACNYSGFFGDDTLQRLAHYGIVDIDWSNAKMVWSNVSPMNDQELLLSQAQTIKTINPATKVWVYRNLVKALPWFTDIREKLLDPAYNKYWFLPFKANGPYHVPPCTNTTGGSSKCSMLYHDQEQTPEHPAQCTNECDCGTALPCGEYLYDHRNKSLQQWLTSVFIMGPNNGTGLNNKAVDGFYIDDSWRDTPGNNAKSCDSSPYGGPSEEDKYCIQDMGLSQQDVTDITTGWQKSMALAENATVAGNGFVWRMFHTVSSPDKSSCTNWLRGTGKNLNDTALMFKYLTLNNTQEQFEIDLVMFLLVRGPYAWLGYGWNGCHSTWAYSEWNPMLDKDYGVPQGPMVQVKTGVFQRKWSKSVVEMDCNQYKPSINFL